MASAPDTTPALLDGPRRICGHTHEEVWRAGPLAVARLRHLRRMLGTSVSSARGTRTIRQSAKPGAERAALDVLVITYVDAAGTAPPPARRSA